MHGRGARRGIGALGVGLAALVVNAALASTPGRWIDYFPARVGERCVQSVTLHSGTTTLVSTATQQIVGRTSGAGATTLVMRVSTVVRQTPPPSTPLAPMAQTIRYTFPADGSVETVPGSYASSLWRYSYAGSEVYPPIAALTGGQTRTGSLAMTMSGATRSATASIAPLLAPGHRSLEISFRYAVGAAPSRGAITTPAGTFRDPVGVQFHITGVSVSDATKKGAAALRSLLTELGSEISATIYFAPGVGAVSTTTLGHTVLLQRCSG